MRSGVRENFNVKYYKTTNITMMLKIHIDGNAINISNVSIQAV